MIDSSCDMRVCVACDINKSKIEYDADGKFLICEDCRGRCGATERKAKRLLAKQVYFARNVNAGTVKIGASAYVSQRIKMLQSLSGCVLYVALVQPGGMKLESQLHNRFSRFSIGREWFDFDPQIESYIKKTVARQRTKWVLPW